MLTCLHQWVSLCKSAERIHVQEMRKSGGSWQTRVAELHQGVQVLLFVDVLQDVGVNNQDWSRQFARGEDLKILPLAFSSLADMELYMYHIWDPYVFESFLLFEGEDIYTHAVHDYLNGV